jgi:hypothetical protein
MRWQDRQRVRELLEARGWKKDFLFQRFEYCKGAFVAALEGREVHVMRVVREERNTRGSGGVRRTDAHAVVGPHRGRGWHARLAATIDATVPPEVLRDEG